MTLLYQYSNFFHDATNKTLRLYDEIVAEGDKALDIAFELAPLREWTRLEEFPALVTLHLEDTDDYAWPY